MERLIKKDEKFKIPLFVVQAIYFITGIVLGIIGIVHKSGYEIGVGFSTILLFPLIYFARKLFKIKGGYQLEMFIYVFSFFGWSLGGAAEFFTKVPYYDKVLHFSSGLFVATLAIALYALLERRHSQEGENPATEIFFVFFCSMAVAGIFEIIEFVFTPIMNRDLQHVGETGVSDTMWDIIVCLFGTLIVTVLMILKACHVMNNPLSDAAEVIRYQNPLPPKGENSVKAENVETVETLETVETADEKESSDEVKVEKSDSKEDSD